MRFYFLSLVWIVFVTALGFYKYNKTQRFNEAVKEESRLFALSKRKEMGQVTFNFCSTIVLLYSYNIFTI